MSVASYLQSLDAVAGFLEKGRAFCAKNNIDLAKIVETRLHADMYPFHFQIISVVHHSLGTMKALASGELGPPSGFPNFDYEGLQGLVNDTIEELKTYTPDVVNALDGKDVSFIFGDTKLPFTASNFVLSFSHPNVYFHAATAYDILRSKGVPVGKLDFMGVPRMKV
jgi:hypothetical protein